MDLITNGTVINDAIKFVQTNKEKLIMANEKDNDNKENKEPDYDDNEDKTSEKSKQENLKKKQQTNPFEWLL